MKFLILCNTYDELSGIKSKFSQLSHDNTTLTSAYNSIEVFFDLYINITTFKGYDKVLCFKSEECTVYEKQLPSNDEITKGINKLIELLKDSKLDDADKKLAVCGIPTLKAQEVYELVKMPEVPEYVLFNQSKGKCKKRFKDWYKGT